MEAAGVEAFCPEADEQRSKLIRRKGYARCMEASHQEYIGKIWRICY
jgi:hypothetical protein